jgi:hypothetical protein
MLNVRNFRNIKSIIPNPSQWQCLGRLDLNGCTVKTILYNLMFSRDTHILP